MNNAGVAGTSGLTQDGFEITIGTNYIGPFYLTSLLLPRLVDAPNGRIVNVASVAHERVKAFDWTWIDRRATGAPSGFPMYAASKLMNILHARAAARGGSPARASPPMRCTRAPWRRRSGGRCHGPCGA